MFVTCSYRNFVFISKKKKLISFSKFDYEEKGRFFSPYYQDTCADESLIVYTSVVYDDDDAVRAFCSMFNVLYQVQAFFSFKYMPTQ